MKLDKIFSVRNGNSLGYGASTKVVFILGFKIVIKKLPFVGLKKIKDQKESDDILCKYINSKRPFMLVRFGNSEINPIVTYLKTKDKNNVKFSEHIVNLIKHNAGFFSDNKQDLIKFAKEFINITKNIDFVIPVLRNSKENKIINLSKNAQLISLNINRIIENPPNWLKCLAGKKVLVIHPFAKTIQKQYKKRKKLFKNPDFLPDFELKTIKAVQGLNPDEHKSYNSWWDALEEMYSKIEKEDFDIALIGAGAFGVFLANKVKSLNKQAIQLCGATQLLFGIKGSRWNNYGIYNEYWVSPSEEETPKDLSKFTQGEPNIAYW